MNHSTRDFISRFFALFIALTLALPNSALALRQVGLEESKPTKDELVSALTTPGAAGLEERKITRRDLLAGATGAAVGAAVGTAATLGLQALFKNGEETPQQLQLLFDLNIGSERELPTKTITPEIMLLKIPVAFSERPFYVYGTWRLKGTGSWVNEGALGEPRYVAPDGTMDMTLRASILRDWPLGWLEADSLVVVVYETKEDYDAQDNPRALASILITDIKPDGSAKATIVGQVRMPSQAIAPQKAGLEEGEPAVSLEKSSVESRSAAKIIRVRATESNGLVAFEVPSGSGSSRLYHTSRSYDRNLHKGKELVVEVDPENGIATGASIGGTWEIYPSFTDHAIFIPEVSVFEGPQKAVAFRLPGSPIVYQTGLPYKGNEKIKLWVLKDELAGTAPRAYDSLGKLIYPYYSDASRQWDAPPLPERNTVSIQSGQTFRFFYTAPVNIVVVGGMRLSLEDSSVGGRLTLIPTDLMKIPGITRAGDRLYYGAPSLLGEGSFLVDRHRPYRDPAWKGFLHVVTIQAGENITKPITVQLAPAAGLEETTRPLEVGEALSEFARLVQADGNQLTRIRFSFNPATVGEQSPGYVAVKGTELELPPAYERQTTDWNDYRPGFNQVSSYSTSNPPVVTVRVEGETIVVEPAAGLEERGEVYVALAEAMAQFRRQGELEFQPAMSFNVGVIADLSDSFEAAVAALYLPAGSTVLVNTSMLLKAEQLTGRIATERGLRLFYVESDQEFSEQINRAIGSFRDVEVVRVLSTRSIGEVKAAVDVGDRDIPVEVRADLGLGELMANLGSIWTQGLMNFLNRVHQSADYSRYL